MKIYKGENRSVIEYETFIFSGGELHIKIHDNYTCDEVTIEAFIKCSDDLMLLLLATDALKRKGYIDIILKMPYVPYARQDRIINEGEAFSLEVFAGIINSQEYKKVYVLDPHSEATTILINNSVNINVMKYIKKIPVNGKTAIISPDKGAKHRCKSIAGNLGLPVVNCSKKRNKQGSIVKTEIKRESFNRCDCLIIDDICDGGRTFIEIAKILKERGASSIRLYVSHGIFSKGLEVFENLIDKIYCVTMFCGIKSEKLTVLKGE